MRYQDCSLRECATLKMMLLSGYLSVETFKPLASSGGSAFHILARDSFKAACDSSKASLREENKGSQDFSSDEEMENTRPWFRLYVHWC